MANVFPYRHQGGSLPLTVMLVLSLVGCAAARTRRVPARAKAVVRTARSYLPEEDGAGRKRPKDCSDFVDRVFAENGVRLPRTAAEMARKGRQVRSTRELRMGDLVFFSGEAVSRAVGHVGIYVNNGIFIHVSKPEIGARMESLYNDYYRKRYLTARRLLD